MKIKITKVLLVILQVFVYLLVAKIVVMLIDSSAIAHIGIGIELPFGWPAEHCSSIASQWGFPFIDYRCPPPEFWCACHRNTIATILNFLFSLGIIYVIVLSFKKLIKILSIKIKSLRRNR